MTEHDISAILRELRVVGAKIDATKKQSADQHMANQHEFSKLREDIRDTNDRVSALERDRVRHSGFIREQSSSMHEVVLEQKEIKSAQATLIQKLNTPLNRTIGLAVALGPTLLVNAEHLLERVWNLLVNLAL